MLSHDEMKAARHAARREAPKTIAEHEERAKHHLLWATSSRADLFGGAEGHMRKARLHLEAARILKALEDLHR